MSSKYSEKGTIKRVGTLKKISEKFSVQEFILETGTQEYPNPVKFQTSGKYLGIVNEQMTGQEATVDFYINGRASAKGYWNTLSAVQVATQNQQQDNMQNNQRQPGDDFIEDDVPF